VCKSGVAPAHSGVLHVSKINRRVKRNLRAVQLPFTAEVKGAVNRTVNHVFHAPFTIPLHKQLLEWVGGNYDPRVFSIEAVNRVLHG